jgi:hypothetical protein
MDTIKQNGEILGNKRVKIVREQTCSVPRLPVEIIWEGISHLKVLVGCGHFTGYHQANR